MLAAHLFLKDRAWVLAHPEAEVPHLAAEGLLQRRERREPLAYILGWREFYGRRFEVNRHVLIPRQETETLVEAALELRNAKPKIQNSNSEIVSPRVLDLGTGSGCIGITLKLERPDWQVTLSDVSADALAVARRNAEALNAKVEIVESDLFENLEGRCFDLVVSNPPYIGREEDLMPEVRDWEPAGALFAPDGGLAVYRALAREAGRHLAEQGSLLVEVGHRQADRVCRMFAEAGWTVDVRRDLSGIERVVVARRT